MPVNYSIQALQAVLFYVSAISGRLQPFVIGKQDHELPNYFLGESTDTGGFFSPFFGLVLVDFWCFILVSIFGWCFLLLLGLRGFLVVSLFCFFPGTDR